MTNKEFDEILERTNAVVCNREWYERAVKALVMVEEFKKAQIITGGRLNGRTYAYKCGLEDRRKEQESMLDKVRAEIETQEKWLAQAGYNAYNVDIAFNSIKLVLAEMRGDGNERKSN